MADTYFRVIASSPDGIVLEPDIEPYRFFIFREETRQYKFQFAGDKNVNIIRDVEPASNRWIYLFGKYKDGNCKVYEIQTDNDGKFDVYKLPVNENAYSRPSPAYKDAVYVKNYDDKNNQITYYVMISEMKLPHKRFFDPQNGLTKDPSIRAANVDDSALTQLVVSDGIEVCSVTNHLKLARLINQGYQNALNEFYKFRYDLTLSGDYPENIRIGQSDENAPHFSDSQETQDERLKRFAASIVLALINKDKKRSAFLEKNGNLFNNYIAEKAKPEIKAHIKIRDKVSLLHDILFDPHYIETIRDYLCDDSKEEFEQHITEAISEIIARLDETTVGQELIGKCYDKNTPFLGKNDTLIPNIVEKALKKTNNALKPTLPAQKVLKSSFSITGNIIKYIMSQQSITFAEKEKEITGIFEKYVKLKIRRKIQDIVDSGVLKEKDLTVRINHPTLPDVLPEMKFDRFYIDAAGSEKYKHLENLKGQLAYFTAVLNMLSLLKNMNDLQAKKDLKSSYLVAKDISALSLWIIELFLKNDKLKPILESKGINSTVLKKVGYTVTAITGTVDAILNGCTAYNDFAKESDVDAGIFKTVETIGSGCLGASGICGATGLGAGASPALAVIGSILSGIGGVGYLVTNDDAASLFLKNCPWGVNNKSVLDCATLKESIEKILSAMYSFKIDATESGKDLNIDIIPKIISPYMKIELCIKAFKGSKTSIFLDANNSTVIHSQEGKTIIRYKYPNYDGNGMEITVNIDTYGDGTFYLPSKGEYTKFTKASKSIYDDYLHRSSMLDESQKTA